MAEAGISAHLIMSITGHKSVGMLAHYTTEAAQRKMAEEAIRQWEKNGTFSERGPKVVKIRPDK